MEGAVEGAVEGAAGATFLSPVPISNLSDTCTTKSSFKPHAILSATNRKLYAPSLFGNGNLMMPSRKGEREDVSSTNSVLTGVKPNPTLPVSSSSSSSSSGISNHSILSYGCTDVDGTSSRDRII